MSKKSFAVHPGEILREDFMNPLGLTAARLARELHIPAPRLHEIVLERRPMTAGTALRLARYFGGSARMWMNLQTAYDLFAAQKRADLSRIQPYAWEKIA
jgi:antitoxin HigA-1